MSEAKYWRRKQNTGYTDVIFANGNCGIKGIYCCVAITDMRSFIRFDLLSGKITTVPI